MPFRIHTRVDYALHHPVAQALAQRIRPVAESPRYPLLAGALAFAGAITMSAPNVPLVCTLVALNRRPWRRIAFHMAVGSALAAALLAFVLEHWARGALASGLMKIGASAQHSLVEAWVLDWGWLALLAIAASPIAQTPAIAAAALFGMPTIEVFAAVFGGKLIKYAVIAYLTQRTLGDSHLLAVDGGTRPGAT